MALLGPNPPDLQMNNLAGTAIVLFSFCFAGRQEKGMTGEWTI
jgi:hypothetical protein